MSVVWRSLLISVVNCFFDDFGQSIRNFFPGNSFEGCLKWGSATMLDLTFFFLALGEPLLLAKVGKSSSFLKHSATGQQNGEFQDLSKKQ